MKKYEDFMTNLKSNMGLDQPGAPTGGFSGTNGKQPEEYDYLDYKDNENRLQELQQELEMNRLRNLFGDTNQASQPPQSEDLLSGFVAPVTQNAMPSATIQGRQPNAITNITVKR